MIIKRPFLDILLLAVYCSFTILLFLTTGQSLAQDSVNDPKISQEAVEESFIELLEKTRDASFKQKKDLIKRLTQLEDEQVPKVLKAMLQGSLFYTKDENKRIVFATSSDQGYSITDVRSNQAIGEVGKREIKKFRVNNSIRTLLRNSLAQLNLNTEDSTLRMKAVKELSRDLTDETGELLRAQLNLETDSEVKSLLQMALAMVDIRSEDKATRLTAVRTLADNLSPPVRGRLGALLDKNADGAFKESDLEVREAALQALKNIGFKLKLFQFTETLFFGLSLGSVLALAAIGLAVTFGVMGVINMAHGELIMIGAYTTYVIQLLLPNHIDLSLFVAIPAAFIISGLFGIAIERSIIRFLYGRPLETLLATFGVSLILQQLVRTVFSPLNRSVATPSWMSGSLEINSALSLTLNRLYIIVFAFMVFLVLLAILKKTRLGLEVRAVSQNRAIAKTMGIRTEWVDAMTFGLGSGIAGVAGVALSQLTNVGPNLGQSYIIDSFMVVVFGGVGNLWGTLIAGMSLGIANKFLEPFAGAVLAKILVLVFIIIFIQKRPRGLFPQKGRAVEN
ncbi:MAG: urea ABC transporter permease subunit UrtB [Methylococcales bacterium]